MSRRRVLHVGHDSPSPIALCTPGAPARRCRGAACTPSSSQASHCRTPATAEAVWRARAEAFIGRLRACNMLEKRDLSTSTTSAALPANAAQSRTGDVSVNCHSGLKFQFPAAAGYPRRRPRLSRRTSKTRWAPVSVPLLLLPQPSLFFTSARQQHAPCHQNATDCPAPLLQSRTRQVIP